MRQLRDSGMVRDLLEVTQPGTPALRPEPGHQCSGRRCLRLLGACASASCAPDLGSHLTRHLVRVEGREPSIQGHPVRALGSDCCCILHAMLLQGGTQWFLPPLKEPGYSPELTPGQVPALHVRICCSGSEVSLWFN